MWMALFHGLGLKLNKKEKVGAGEISPVVKVYTALAEVSSSDPRTCVR